MKHILLGLTLSAMASAPLSAQTTKLPVYGEIGLGVGLALFRSNTQVILQKALGGSGFAPGLGNNLMMGFYLAPEHWRGLGLGTRIRGTFGTGVKGRAGDTYIFNYYNLALSAKYYPSGQFNRGLYGRGNLVSASLPPSAPTTIAGATFTNTVSAPRPCLVRAILCRSSEPV